MILLLLPLLLYAGLCLLLLALQDRMVFVGAGQGERSDVLPHGVVTWIGDGEARTRLVSIADDRPHAVVLYFVGNGEDLAAAAQGGEVLARYGCEVIGVEYPGYGASRGTPSAASLMATADGAAGFARARARALGLPLVVVGSSLGSFCATHVAAQGGVARLVLRAPPTSLLAVAQQQYWWLPVSLLLRHRLDNLASAPQIDCPTLVVHGDADRVVPLAHGRELARALPHGQLLIVPGRGHNDLSLAPDGPAGKVLAQFLGGA